MYTRVRIQGRIVINRCWLIHRGGGVVRNETQFCFRQVKLKTNLFNQLLRIAFLCCPLIADILRGEVVNLTADKDTA